MSDPLVDHAVLEESPAGVPNDPLGALRVRLVAEWIVPAVGDVTVGFGPPGSLAGEDQRLTLTLLDLLPSTIAGSGYHPGPLQSIARILVTAEGPDADQMLVALAFAALERGDPELERDEVPNDLWMALGLPRRLGLRIRAVLERSRVPTRAPRVREVVAHWVAGRALVGRVVGPGDLPLAGARVEVAGTGIRTFADDRGEFRLSPIPSGPAPPIVTVTAKGTQLVVRADPPDAPLLIRVPLPEP